MSDPRNITKAEGTAAEEEVADAVKAALLISGADKRRYGRLKEQLANNYLLGTDQYPDTLEKASRILGNYQVAKGPPFEDRKNTNEGGGLAFLQRGARTPGRGCGGRGAQTAGRGGGSTAGGADTASVGASTIASGVRGQTTRERAIATIAGAKVTGQTNAQNWQKNNKLSFT